MKHKDKSIQKFWYIVIFFITLVTLTLFTSCEKEPISHNGTYYGTITYYLSGEPQLTTARRIISNNGEGTTQFHWWDAPPVDCYSVITNNSYPINNVEIFSDPTCNGVKQKDKLLFNGKGTFIGDSLVEEGIVYHYTNINTEQEQCESGTWRAYFKKF